LDKRFTTVIDKTVVRKSIPMEVPAMAFKDKNKVLVTPGDIVKKGTSKYEVKFIESYPTATVVIAENIKTHKVETFLLKDVEKI